MLQTGAAMHTSEKDPDGSFPWLAWSICLPLLLLFMGSATAWRTQESRVLETAREMVEGSSPWLTPQCNGELRLQKPPLAYWMTAGAFKIGGINEWAGRAPAVLVTWLTIGLCGHMASTLFGRRAGLLSIVLMTATYGAFRFGRLAETDTIAMLGVTLGVWGFWRASETNSNREVTLWNWAAAIGMSIAAMGKGAPAAFPVLFLVTWCIINRTARPLWTFVRSGGILIFAIFGLGWYGYIYIWEFGGLSVVEKELGVVLSGSNHAGPIYYYLFSMLMIVMPWSLLLISALNESIRQFRKDMRLQHLLIWFAACFVPLSLAGNKQMHYTLALLPAASILMAWLLDWSFRAEAPNRVRVWVPRLIELTAIVMLIGIVAMPLVRMLKSLESETIGILIPAVGAVACLLGIIWMGRSLTRVRGIAACGVGVAIVFSVIMGPWGRAIEGLDHGDVAHEVTEEYGDVPILVFDSHPDLSALFGMRETAEVTRDEARVKQWVMTNPNGIIIFADDGNPWDDQLPPSLVPIERFGSGAATIWRLALRPQSGVPGRRG